MNKWTAKAFFVAPALVQQRTIEVLMAQLKVTEGLKSVDTG